MAGIEIATIEMHTGGEPVRIVTTGYPALVGRTLLEKRDDANARFDHVRTFLMHEPRGHRDMYGVVLVQPDDPGADVGVLFMHNAGYSTMCGHAVLAIGRYAVDSGLVERVEPVTRLRIQAPCGLVETEVEVGPEGSGSVRFISVPAFVQGVDQVVAIPGIGDVRFDLAYGGAFYAISPAPEFGLHLDAPVAELTAAAAALTDHLRAGPRVEHPTERGLGGVYGTILTDGQTGLDVPSRNVCVFADAQVDRSPTGSGVTARMALMAADGRARPGDHHTFESLTGHRMTAQVVATERRGPVDTVRVEVEGMAHYTGRATFTLEESDPLKHGFLLR